MDSHSTDSEPQLSDERPEAEEDRARAAARHARTRAAILAGMTVGAIAVSTLGGGPTTVAGVIL